MESTRASPTNITHVHVYTYMDGCAHNAPPCMRTTRKNEMVGWTHWTDTGLIWWDSTTVLPVLHGTIGQDGQGFFRAVVAVLHGTIGQDGQGFFRAVVAVLHGTMGTDTIGYYSTLVYRARPSSHSRNFRTRIIKRGREAGERV